MNILALDTSAKAASCAILSDGKLLGEFFTNAGFTHSQTILPMVQSLLDCTLLTAADIDLFAVATGPGSFTGLRIGISAAKGMAIACDKPCCAVSTLEALAHNLSDFAGYIIPAMDARREQVYAAVFQNGTDMRRVCADEALSIADLTARLALLPPAPMILVGDGAELCFTKMREQLPDVLLANENLRYQRAASVAKIAQKSKPVSAELLEPVYLRLPQAERERLEKIK